MRIDEMTAVEKLSSRTGMCQHGPKVISKRDCQTCIGEQFDNPIQIQELVRVIKKRIKNLENGYYVSVSLRWVLEQMGESEGG